ncbi:hypothetical protein [Wolbachia endosymbiont of Armadillidium arcangelii]|uniref:Uncharacterized protein n=1 Tax=Wolbachia endosymbiont of Armadillidium arcangelii TaxID=3158571 RepID=A0AAU7Q3D5_9RICK
MLLTRFAGGLSLSTRTNSCIPTRVACITDSRCHRNFDPRHDGLELNIQLPDFDLNIPPCPACPPCPSYPQPKPEPKPKELVDLSKLSTRINILTDDIVNAHTELPTGLKSKECAKIIMNAENDLEIKGGKLVGECYNSPKCDECVEAINSSIIEKQYADPFVSDHNIPALEGIVYIL